MLKPSGHVGLWARQIPNDICAYGRVIYILTKVAWAQLQPTTKNRLRDSYKLAQQKLINHDSYAYKLVLRLAKAIKT